MGTRDFLLEIGTEEIPARFVQGATRQLAEKVQAFLRDRRIAFGVVRTYATPRRLAVLVEDVAEKQEDVSEEVRGPAKHIAVDEAGNWTKAAEGFARKQGVALRDLFIREVKGVPYVFARKYHPGAPTREILTELGDVIRSLSFPKSMRWGTHDLRFVRPIRWLVALFGADIVPIEVAGVRAGNVTRGHRFLGRAVTIDEPAHYETLLEAQYVIADVEKRCQLIVDQIRALEAEKGWRIPIDEGLLEEVTHLVEYPTVLWGAFDEEFLAVNRHVLVTAMREHQRYFPVENVRGELLPYFVTVRNGDDRHLDTVRKGNEKVLRARLADARFFYEEDQKLTIPEALTKLKTIVYHEDLGTLADKVDRVRALSARVADALGLDEETKRLVDRTAEICKFDLVTQMVYEFPELEGIMGEDYARRAGEPEAVARGVFEHHLPRFAGDQLPASDVGAVVGVADKVDTLVGFFSLGLIPTGSQDPYALRRATNGVVQILLDRKWPLALDALVEAALDLYAGKGLGKRPADAVKADLLAFFAQRLKTVLQEEGIRYDVIDAVLGSDFADLRAAVARAKVLEARHEEEAFRAAVEAFTRLYNLSRKAETAGEVQEALFEDDAERALYRAYGAARERARAAEEAGDWAGVLDAWSALAESIHAFFDAVLVMAPDPAVRQNRLSLIKRIADDLWRYADFSKLVLA